MLLSWRRTLTFQSALHSIAAVMQLSLIYMCIIVYCVWKVGKHLLSNFPIVSHDYISCIVCTYQQFSKYMMLRRSTLYWNSTKAYIFFLFIQSIHSIKLQPHTIFGPTPLKLNGEMTNFVILNFAWNSNIFFCSNYFKFWWIWPKFCMGL